MIDLVNYNKIRNSLKKYTSNVDVNMHHNGWNEIGSATDLDEGVKSCDEAKDMIYARFTAREVKKYIFCFRRRCDNWGIPAVTVYLKKKSKG